MKHQNQKTRAWGRKNLVEIYNGNESKLTKIPFSIFFPSSKCVKIARSAIQRYPIN